MHLSDPLFTIVVLLTAGVLGLMVARFARISPIVGFFALGALIGPYALGFVDNNTAAIHFMGELGVSFLLFDIGLHLSLKELREGWRKFLLSGSLQFALVTAALSAGLLAIGLSSITALLLAAIFSLSSTALVLKILADESEEASPIGKRATEVLVFQDVIAILLLVILSGDISNGISIAALGQSLLKMLLAAMLVVFIGRIALKPLFRLFISLKSDEVITAFALLLVFVTSWGTQSVGLSLALGAFLGGLALSESSYSYLVRGEISPFRALLLSLFFLSVGINLELPTIAANLGLLFSLLLGFIVLKIGAQFVAFKIAGIDRGLRTLLSFLLAQGSEFAFVLLGVAGAAGLLDNQTLTLSVSLVGLSLAVTPFLASIGCYSSRSVCTVAKEHEAHRDDPREVIIVRIDEYGRQLATFLEAERIPYRAHDNDLERLAYAKSRGFNVYYADLNRPRTLGRVSMGKVLAVVTLLEDDDISKALIEGLHKIDRSVPVVAATESPARLELLSSLGVESTFIKNESSVVALFETVMQSLGFETTRIEEALSRVLQQLKPEGLFPKIEPEAFAESASA